MFKRDQIMFNPQDDSDDDDDVNGGQGEAVMGLDLPEREDAEDDEDEDDWEEAAPKARKEKVKADLSTKGRFGKDDDSDDFEEDDNDSAAGTDDDEEGWGRQYYSRPSARREKERDDVYDEKREEERELEEKEVQRLQRKAREAIGGAEDWGLDDVEVEFAAPKVEDDAEPVQHVPAPQTSEPAALIRHMQFHEPLKLALARDFPLVVQKLQKTARGIDKMEAEAEGEETLHKGLGWLHYQTLLTYATTLAFYIHLCAMPVEERPDVTAHPILERLLQLKEGVAALESLDFAAGSVSDPGIELYMRPGMEEEDEEDEEEHEALIAAKKELMARMLQRGGAQGDGGDAEDDWETDEFDLESEDAQNLWNADSFEDNELQDLLADQQEDVHIVPVKKTKTGKRERSRKGKKSKVVEEEPAAVSFTPIAEPTFVASTKKKSKKSAPIADSDETLGDMLELDDADATDKERQKKSLRFHTSKIAAMSNRRSAARERKLGGDDDVPYRDRQAARDAALRKNAPKGASAGSDLDGSEWTDSDRKRAREVRDEAEEFDEAPEDDGYYDLVKRRKVAKDEEKAAAHDAFMDDKFASFEDETSEGPRAINRAIEKNRGLTPRRSKTGRNPRVKKRQAYEKAKQKVGSQRAVFKGGQASLSGSYSGEKSGISTVVKSRKF